MLSAMFGYHDMCSLMQKELSPSQGPVLRKLVSDLESQGANKAQAATQVAHQRAPKLLCTMDAAKCRGQAQRAPAEQSPHQSANCD